MHKNDHTRQKETLRDSGKLVFFFTADPHFISYTNIISIQNCIEASMNKHDVMQLY